MKLARHVFLKRNDLQSTVLCSETVNQRYRVLCIYCVFTVFIVCTVHSVFASSPNTIGLQNPNYIVTPVPIHWFHFLIFNSIFWYDFFLSNATTLLNTKCIVMYFSGCRTGTAWFYSQKARAALMALSDRTYCFCTLTCALYYHFYCVTFTLLLLSIHGTVCLLIMCAGIIYLSLRNLSPLDISAFWFIHIKLYIRINQLPEK